MNLSNLQNVFVQSKGSKKVDGSVVFGGLASVTSDAGSYLTSRDCASRGNISLSRKITELSLQQIIATTCVGGIGLIKKTANSVSAEKANTLQKQQQYERRQNIGKYQIPNISRQGINIAPDTNNRTKHQLQKVSDPLVKPIVEQHSVRT